jgi:hypothetical protein
MSTNELGLAAELRVRHGVTTRRRLRDLGITDPQITGLIRRGRLAACGHGVLVSEAHADTFERRVAVACAITGGAATFPTAGVLWQFRKTPRVPELHLVVPWHRRISAPVGVRIHRTRQLPETDLVHRPDGIVVVSPPRMAFDAARWLGADDLESLIEQGVERGNFTVPTLWAHGRRLCHQCREGSALFARVLSAREPWRRPVRSDYELVLERALGQRGFPPFARGHPLEISSGVQIHPDLGLPDDGFFIEIDHLSWHGGRLENAYDKWRDRKVRLLGAHVERVSDIAIDRQLDETVEDLWVLWQRRRGALAAGAVA